MIRKLLIGVGVLVGLLIVVAVLAPRFIPSSTVRPWIEQEASAALGRQVTIAGDVGFSVVPRITARANDVTIANAQGFGAEPFASVEQLRVDVKLLPLITGRADVDEFAIVRPTLRLEQNANGAVNWMLGAPSEGEAGASEAGEAQPFERRPGAVNLNARLGDVRIVDGAGVYIDGAAGTETALSDLNLTLRLESFDRPLTVDADFEFNAQAHRLDLRLDTPQSFFNGEETPFTLEFASETALLDIDGAFAQGSDIAFAGDVRLDVRSVRELAAQAGVTLPDGDIYKRARITGRASGDANAVAFEDATVLFDDIEGDGAIRVDISGARPMLTGALSVGDVDVTLYAPAAPDGDGDANTSSGDGPGGWSEEPLDLSVLRLADANLNLSVGVVKFGSLQIGPGDMTAVVDNGRLEVDLSRLQAYDGRLIGQLVANARSPRPSFSVDVSLAEFQANPFLAAIADFDRLTGVGAFDMSFTTSGASIADLMAGLDGSGDFGFSDGAIRGVNMGALAGGLQSALDGNFSLAAFTGGQETRYAQLAGAFSVDNGVARLGDFTITNPSFEVSAGGSLNLADQTVDLSLKPRLTNETEATGLAARLAGAGVPIRVSGSWGSISPSIDDSALRALAAQAASSAVTDRLGGEAGSLLEGLIQEDLDEDDVAEGLRKLLDRKKDDG